MTGGGAWALSLDFGTTATAAAIRANGGPVSELVMPNGATTVSSSVFAEEDGALVVGAEADNEAELRLEAYEPTPKRRVGDTQVPLGENRYAPAELIGAVIAPVIEEAVRQHNNTPPGSVVMTHPWSWRAPRKRILREALDNAASQLQLAALPDPAFVPEPVAAARWYASADAPRDGSCFAVYDLGGGTFDTTVLRATANGGYEVLASGGIDPLGGFDFDRLLFDYLGEKHIARADAALWAGLSSPGQADPDLAHRRRQLQGKVHLLKEALTSQNTKNLRLPGLSSPVIVTRTEYEDLIRQHIDDTVTELEDTIAEAGLEPAELTAIYRVGGAARTPLVGAALGEFHLKVKATNHPKLVVAQGAATIPTQAPPADPPPESSEQATATHDPSQRAADAPRPPTHRAVDPPATRAETPAKKEPAKKEPQKKASPLEPSGATTEGADTGKGIAAVEPPGRLRRLGKTLLTSGVLTLVLAVVAELWEPGSSYVIFILFGIYALMGSVTQALFASLVPRNAIRVLLLFGSAALLVLGVSLSVSRFLPFLPFVGDLYGHFYDWLWWLVPVVFVLRGGAQTMAAARDNRLPGRGWFIFAGVVSLVVGIVFLGTGYRDPWQVWHDAGRWFLLIGLCEIVASFGIRRTAGSAPIKR